MKIKEIEAFDIYEARHYKAAAEIRHQSVYGQSLVNRLRG